MARLAAVILLFLLATMAVAAPPGKPSDPKPPKGPKNPKSPPPPPPPIVQSPLPAFPPTMTPGPAPGPSIEDSPPPPPTVEPPTAQPPPPPPTSQPPPAGPPPSPKTVKCRNKKYPTCAGIQLTCPDACPNTCSVDCETCSPVCQCNKPGGVCEDPRFVGGDGIAFYFHGRRDRDFCLLSDSDLHINAHFIGRRNPNMNRDFTWVQSIAVLFHNNHRLYIGAMRTSTWDDSVDRISIAFDGELISLPAEDGASWRSSVAPSITIVRSSETNAVVVEVDGMFRISAAVVPITEEDSRVHRYGVTSDDCFAHLELGFKFYSLTGDVHGVLGQTYREDYVSRVKLSAAMPIMGGEHRFSTSDLYAADCKVARFGHGGGGGGIAMVLGEQEKDLMCSSDIGGRGIVCRK